MNQKIEDSARHNVDDRFYSDEDKKKIEREKLRWMLDDLEEKVKEFKNKLIEVVNSMKKENH